MEMNVNKFKLEVLQDLIDLLGSLMAQYSGHMKIIMQAQQKRTTTNAIPLNCYTSIHGPYSHQPIY